MTMEGIFVGLYLAFRLVFLVLFIATLIHQAKKKRWVWFVFTIIFSLITMIIYWVDKRKELK